MNKPMEELESIELNLHRIFERIKSQTSDITEIGDRLSNANDEYLCLLNDFEQLTKQSQRVLYKLEERLKPSL